MRGEERRGRKCEWEREKVENAESIRPKRCAAAVIIDVDTKY